MDYRDVVVALTDLGPENKRKAVVQLDSASREDLKGLALFIARLLSTASGRTVGVWAMGALVSLWRDDIEASVLRGESPSSLTWPVIEIVREQCLPLLFELRTSWFGWNEWDDCVIIAPLASLRRDVWYDAAANILFAMASRQTPAAPEASLMSSGWFTPPLTAQERASL